MSASTNSRTAGLAMSSHSPLPSFASLPITRQSEPIGASKRPHEETEEDKPTLKELCNTKHLPNEPLMSQKLPLSADLATIKSAQYKAWLRRTGECLGVNPWSLLRDNVVEIKAVVDNDVPWAELHTYEYTLKARFNTKDSELRGFRDFYASSNTVQDLRPHLDKLFNIDGLPFRFSTTREDSWREELAVMCAQLVMWASTDQNWDARNTDLEMGPSGFRLKATRDGAWRLP